MKAKVNDRFEYWLSDQREIEILEREGDRFRIRLDNKHFHAELLEFQFHEKKALLSMEGFVFEVQLSRPLDEVIQDLRSQLSETAGAQEYTAPIPGVIKSLPGIAGESVQKGDVLVILEAMKMENTILATSEGERLTYFVSPGEKVVKGQILCSLE